VKVLLADDHRLVRAGLRRLLEELPGVLVVGEADDGDEAVELAETLLPDVVIADISMPGMSGVELTRWLAKNFPHVRVIILSMHSSGDYVVQALNAGAHAYLLKHSAAEEIGLALRAVTTNQSYLSAGISHQMVDAYMKEASGQPAAEEIGLALRAVTTNQSYLSAGISHQMVDAYMKEASGQAAAGPNITPRQRQVLKLVAEGKSSKEIAAILDISPRTVDTHRADLMERLGARDVVGLLREAARLGLVSLDPGK